jgi:hypothetical protein
MKRIKPAHFPVVETEADKRGWLNTHILTHKFVTPLFRLLSLSLALSVRCPEFVEMSQKPLSLRERGQKVFLGQSPRCLENPPQSPFYKGRELFKKMCLSVFLISLNACSGSGLDIAEGGIDGSGMSIGPISAFGSIYVNGVKYDTDTATVSINGDTLAADDLRLGMMVTLEGRVSADGEQGTALSVSFTDDVRGAVSQISATGFSVAAQRISVDQRTVFAGIEGLNALSTGDFVRISGVASDDGFLATRVVLDMRQANTHVRGRVSAHDAANYRFMLNALRVDYHNALYLDVMPENGAWVTVHGVLANGILQAERIDSGRKEPNTGRFDVRGRITRFVSTEEFAVDFRPVKVTANTGFRFGSAEDLQLGAEVIAHGQIDAGVLQLARVEFTSATRARSAPGAALIRAPLDAIDVRQRQLGALGLTIEVPLTTVLQATDSRLSLNDLAGGDWLEIHGFVDLANNRMVAERIRRIPPAPQVKLQGPARHDGDSIQVLGLDIVPDADCVCLDNRKPPLPGVNAEINAREFLANAPDNLISVSGQMAGHGVAGARLELMR